MSPPRAGVLVTGTEVLSGIIADRNGPWLAERMRGLGIELAYTIVVADRPADIRSCLDYLRSEGCSLIVTSGGLGPTADDLTAEVVGAWAGRRMVLDEALEERIFAILTSLRRRYREWDPEALRAANRKQAVVPEQSVILDPVGTAPGLVVPFDGGAVVVLPGPPRELHPMWEAALETEPVRELLRGAGTLEQRIVRLFGIPESEIAQSLEVLQEEGLDMTGLEITTCLRRGEIEIATVFAPAAAGTYDEFERAIRARHESSFFSADGSTIDEQVAGLLRGSTIAVAESCTGGLMTARLTDVPGSSEYVLGGVTAYSDEAKVALAGVPADLIAEHGAVSEPVAAALADGAMERFGAQLGIGITGIAGPGGGSEDKPVGLVCFSVAQRGGDRIDRAVQLPGDRATVRERSTTVAMHLLRRLLAGP